MQLFVSPVNNFFQVFFQAALSEGARSSRCASARFRVMPTSPRFVKHFFAVFLFFFHFYLQHSDKTQQKNQTAMLFLPPLRTRRSRSARRARFLHHSEPGRKPNPFSESSRRDAALTGHGQAFSPIAGGVVTTPCPAAQRQMSSLRMAAAIMPGKISGVQAKQGTPSAASFPASSLS